jgi:hypothetical protein
MTIDSWLQAAIADAERRGLPDLKPLLEALARATKGLRAADFNDSAAPSHQPPATRPPLVGNASELRPGSPERRRREGGSHQS